MIHEYTPPPSNLPPGSTVWAYLRDSGGPSQDRSVTQQREIVLEYCARHGFTLERVFADVHQTGTKDDREQFRTMISLVEHNQKPDGLILWSFARFARNELDANYYKSLLRKKGLVVYSLIQDIPEGKYAAVMEALIHISDQEKSEQAAWESKRGLMHIVKQGAMPGRPPYGMMRVPLVITSDDGTVRTLHRWVPDPEVAPRVRQAFEMRVAGASIAAIHAETRLYGSLNSYTTFFTNKIYTGILEFGGETIENYCEAIVPIETFNAVQTISADFANRQHVSTNASNHPRRVNSSFLLAGLAHCARCGSLLAGHTSPTKSEKHVAYLSYRCPRKKQNRDCDLPTIPAKALEQCLINDGLDYLAHHPELIEAMHATAAKASESSEAEQAEKIKTINAELRKIRTQINNTINAIAEVGHSKSLLDKLTNLETERERRELQLREMETKQIYAPADAQIIQSKLLGIKPMLEHANISTRQTILRNIIQRVDADRDGDMLIIGIVLNLPKKKADIMPLVGYVPLSQPSVGALLYRHVIVVPIKRKTRSR
jgi:DNA invertase Pin-like site-specific DNA recombinase